MREGVFFVFIDVLKDKDFTSVAGIGCKFSVGSGETELG
jgi:hypothetical protein